MVIHHDSQSILKNIDKYFTFKPSSIGEPDIYLGVKLRKMTMPNSVWFWSMSPSKYIQEDVRNCETHIKEQYRGRYSLVKDGANPFAYHYGPKVNVSEPLDPEISSYYQYPIEIIQWMVEQERVDIATEVSMLWSHNAYPQRGTFCS